MFILVCFDIVEDLPRAKVVKVLKEYGQRVQKSVFECPNLKEGGFFNMKNRIEDLVDIAEDSVRYYALCGSCVSKVEFTGKGQAPDKEVYRVV